MTRGAPGFLDAADATAWPDTIPPGMRAYLTAIADPGPRALVANAHATGRLLRAGDAVLPVIVPHSVQPSDPAAFLVPTVHHIEYPRRTFVRHGPGVLSAPLRGLRNTLRAAGLDRVVYLNHWLTTGSPELPPVPLDDTIAVLRKSYPDRAIVVPDIVPDLDTDAAAALEHQGAWPVPTRTIRVFDPVRSLSGRRFRTERNNLNAGRRLLRERAALALPRDVLPSQTGRMAALYRASYVDRHSLLNPDYTEVFFANLLHAEPVQATGWSHGGNADAPLAAFSMQWLGRRAITWSVFGRDPAEPDDRRSYETALARDIEAAETACVPIRWGAGADAFKRNRGARKHLQVEMVFATHLSATQQAAWRALQRLRRSRFTDTGKG